MERTRFEQRITIRSTNNITKSIDSLADELGVSRSNVIRMAIASFLKKWND